MLTLCGTLIHTFKSPKGTNKDGDEYGGQDKVQILGEIPLPNGETKNDLITLTTHELSRYADLASQKIRVPVGIFANGKSITYFIPKGSQPELA